MNFAKQLFIASLIIALGCSCPKKIQTSEYPVAVDIKKVGEYPALTKSGGGFFYDDVLEYRVWVHTDNDDYYKAFATFEEAELYSKKTKRAERPLVLVFQDEHINEPQPGVYEHVTEDRITEWLVEWLADSKRESDSIDKFMGTHSNK